ncbi:two-component system sensor histidine kinase UhpB [Azospirillum lipoferum]|nr:MULTISPECIES: ATP-binding protein [Azospirillum]MCP1611873.1 two-component system sensor histidine kinase UhpB [Azospirillum lipoferum]MDW5533368.1 histidine kinase [Azospirillum sp. NL1]
MSLRMRILALIGLFLLLMATAGGAVMVANARDAVRAEMASALELGGALGLAVAERGDIPGGIAMLNGLGLRHLRFIGADGLPKPEPAERRAPDWFAALIGGDVQERRLGAGGLPVGLRIIAEPWDEIAEVWEDMSDLAAAMLAVGLLLMGAAHLAVGRALAPLSRLEAGVERLRAGDYAFSFDGRGIPELDRLGRGIAALANGLAAAECENRQAGQRIVAAQDAERREIAREIHDELGAALFAIKVDAGRILRLRDGGAEGEATKEAAERAGKILDTAGEVHRLSRRILARLRPALLDQLPLSEVLAELAGDWMRRQPDIALTLAIEPASAAADLDGCDEVLRLTVYRLVQESLVNAFRHAKPSAIAVSLRIDPETVEIIVTDDGPGLPEGDEAGKGGFGISGMAERVRTLGGILSIGAAAGGGTRLSARLPRPALSPSSPPALERMT